MAAAKNVQTPEPRSARRQAVPVYDQGCRTGGRPPHSYNYSNQLPCQPTVITNGSPKAQFRSRVVLQAAWRPTMRHMASTFSPRVQ